MSQTCVLKLPFSFKTFGLFREHTYIHSLRVNFENYYQITMYSECINDNINDDIDVHN